MDVCDAHEGSLAGSPVRRDCRLEGGEVRLFVLGGRHEPDRRRWEGRWWWVVGRKEGGEGSVVAVRKDEDVWLLYGGGG